MGEGAGGYFEQHLAELMTLLQLWVGGTNKMWFLTETMIFQYFTFKLLILPLTKLIIAVFSTLQWHVI